MSTSGGSESWYRRALHGAALLVLLLAAWWWLAARGDAAPPVVEVEAGSPAMPAPPVAAALQPSRERETVFEAPPVIETDAAPVDLSLPYEYTLHLRVVDPFGLPVPDAHVFVAPPRCGLGRWPATSDLRGELTVTCRGRTGVLPLLLCVFAHGTAEPLQSIELEPSRPRTLVVCARGRLADTSEMERLLAEGDPQALRRLYLYRKTMRDRDERLGKRGSLQRTDPLDLLCGRRLMLFAQTLCTDCHAPSVVQGYEPLQWAPDLHASPLGHVAFADIPPSPLPKADREQRARELQAPRYDVALQQLIEQRGRTAVGFVQGRVVAGDQPAVGVPVAWLDADGALRLRVDTDGAGRYTIALPVGIACRLVAGGGSQGSAEALVATAPGEHMVQDFALRAAMLVAGGAFDAAGHPLVDWRVELESPRHDAVAATDALGQFAFADAPEPGRLLLWPADGDLELPVAIHDGAGFGRAVRLRLDRAGPTRSRLRVRAQLPPGHGKRPVELRVWQLESNRAAHLHRTGRDDGFELEGLAAGTYRGEVGAPGLGFVPFGPFALDGRGLWDVGVVALPAPGRVRVRAREADRARPPHAFYRRTEHTDVAVVPIVQPQDDAVLLPPGDYVVVAGEGERRSAAAFVVRSGELTEVALP